MVQETVVWGESNKEKANAMADAIKNFVEKDLHMDNVYKYMLSFLQEYATLQRFRPKDVITDAFQPLSFPTLLSKVQPLST